MLKKHSLSCFVLSLSLSLLTGCQTTHKSAVLNNTQAIPAANVKIKTTSYIYLNPLPKEDRTIFISIKNDSGTNVFDPQPWLVKSLQERSFKLVNNIDEANVVLRANLFRVGNINKKDAAILLGSEFGNSAELISPDSLSDTTAATQSENVIILDLQYFDRRNLVDSAQAKARTSMANVTDTQLLLLCNTSRWERFQSRIISMTADKNLSQQEKFSILGQSIANANTDILRGLS